MMLLKLSLIRISSNLLVADAPEVPEVVEALVAAEVQEEVGAQEGAEVLEEEVVLAPTKGEEEDLILDLDLLHPEEEIMTTDDDTAEAVLTTEV